MNRGFVASVLVSLALLGGPCAAQPHAPVPPGINWEQTPVVKLTLSVGFFRPGKISLRMDEPVRLIFNNGGGRTHDFVTNLFGSVSQRPGAKRGSVRVILQVADSVEYDIIPRVPGTYTVTTVMYERPGAVPPVQVTVTR